MTSLLLPSLATTTTTTSEALGLSKAIYLVGPQSTGKTTLLNALRRHYDEESTPYLSEIARQVLQAKLYTADDLNGERCLQMQLDIFTAHFQAEMNLFAKGQFEFISDRSAIDPIIYSMQYCKQVDGWYALRDTPMWKILGSWYRDPTATLVVLLEPIEEFLLPDGTRKMPENWAEMSSLHFLFRDFMEAEGIPFESIGQECRRLEDRVAKVMEWAAMC